MLQARFQRELDKLKSIGLITKIKGSQNEYVEKCSFILPL
jgi:hypothetical protein